MSNLSATDQKRTRSSPSTLGDVLYAKAKVLVLEQDWAALVQSMASGDQLALHALYERAHRPVFTLIMRITATRETAEELTLDVFHDVGRRASLYDAANGPVLGWIMNQARSRAIDRLRFESRKKRSNGGAEQPQAEIAADPSDVLELREQGEALRAALSALTLAPARSGPAHKFDFDARRLDQLPSVCVSLACQVPTSSPPDRKSALKGLMSVPLAYGPAGTSPISSAACPQRSPSMARVTLKREPKRSTNVASAV